MKLRLLSLLLLVYCAGTAWGQGIISGEVGDSLSGKPLDATNVLLLKGDTSGVVQVMLADSLGRFRFTHVAAGSYQLKANYVGYVSKLIAVTLTAQKMEIISLKVELIPQGGNLQEVEILSEKPVIRNTPGKIIFDVAKTVSDGAETATESLQKIPGVNVSQDGAVSVHGKSGVRILVDGRTNPMAQTNPEQFLKSIPAKNIETIEVNTAPSAKYDASGSGIVINIKLKKGRLEGFNGSLAAGIGTVFNKYNGSGNFNYKKGKLNFFGNAYYNDERKWSRSSDNRKVTGDSTVFFNQHSEGKSHSHNGSGKLGLEYAMDKKHALTYSIDGNTWNWASARTGTGDSRDANNFLINTTAPGSSGNNGDISFTNALNYHQTFDTTDRAFSIDLAHTYDKHFNNGQSYSRAYDATGAEIASAYFNKRTLNKGITQNILVQSDFNTPFKKVDGSNLEVGVKEEMNIFDSQADVFDVTTGSDIRDSLQSSRFKYIESVSAAYGSFAGEYKSFTYSAGLRWEHTYVSSAMSSVRQNYSSFFPTITLGYKINDNHTLSVDYGRNIDRPGFWMLNNSVSYNNAYSVSSGNPSIKPAFSNSVTLEYNGTFGKQSLNFSGAFSRTDGTFQSISTVDSNYITHSHYENSGYQMNVYFHLSASFKIGKNFDFSLSPGTGHSWYNYIYENKSVAVERTSFNLWASATLRFWKNASIQAWGWMNSGYSEAQSTNQPVGSLTITVKKKFFNDHFIVSLSCRDVFNTMRWKSRTLTPTLDSRSDWKSESRVGYLTLTYQFGKQSFSPEGKTKGKSGRIGGGGGGGGGP